MSVPTPGRRLPRWARSTVVALGSALAAGVIGGCMRPPPRPTPLAADAYPGTLRSAEIVAYDFLWRQQVTARWGEGEARGFQAVLQKQGAVLKLVALSPVGQPGFVLTLDGTSLSVENRAGRELPFPARFILLDVQRAFYPWGRSCGAEGGGAPEQTFEVAGERVTETCEGGRLRRRRFERLDGEPAGAIRVAYEGWGEGEDAPAKVVLDNGWFGYRLEIQTVEQRRLP